MNLILLDADASACAVARPKSLSLHCPYYALQLVLVGRSTPCCRGQLHAPLHLIKQPLSGRVEFAVATAPVGASAILPCVLL